MASSEGMLYIPERIVDKEIAVKEKESSIAREYAPKSLAAIQAVCWIEALKWVKAQARRS